LYEVRFVFVGKGRGHFGTPHIATHRDTHFDKDFVGGGAEEVVVVSLLFSNLRSVVLQASGFRRATADCAREQPRIPSPAKHTGKLQGAHLELDRQVTKGIEDGERLEYN
jgi:hypothetical protein